MRADGRRDQGVILPGFQKFSRAFQGELRRGVVRCREANHGLGEDAAESGVGGFLGDGVFEVVHIDEGRGAGASHFQKREPGAPADEVAVDVVGFGREDEVVQPVLENHVIGDAAKQGHGGVGVGVDESGGEDRVGLIDLAGGVVAGFDLGAGANRDDVVAFDSNGSVLDHGHLVVCGGDVAGAPDQVDRSVLGKANQGTEGEA